MIFFLKRPLSFSVSKVLTFKIGESEGMKHLPTLKSLTLLRELRGFHH